MGHYHNQCGARTSVYLCIYHLPYIYQTLVPKICVRTEVIRVHRYIDVVHMRNCQDRAICLP